MFSRKARRKIRSGVETAILFLDAQREGGPDAVWDVIDSDQTTEDSLWQGQMTLLGLAYDIPSAGKAFDNFVFSGSFQFVPEMVMAADAIRMGNIELYNPKDAKGMIQVTLLLALILDEEPEARVMLYRVRGTV